MGQKKRQAASLFDAVEVIETQDSQVRRRRSNNLAQSRAAKSQTAIYSRLLEGRILLQRALTSDASATSAPARKKRAVDECDKLLELLLKARAQLREADDTPDYASQIQDSKALDDTLQDEYEECREQWKEVLNRRHKDVRLQSGMTYKSQFKVVDAPFWQQVTSTVQHDQLRREEKSGFEDTKVYQQLLQDFVRQDPSSASTGNKSTRAIEKSKATKKNVDRRASKGRKIRYAVLPKLVNFTFPVSRKTDSLMDQDEWFKSLFGGSGH